MSNFPEKPKSLSELWKTIKTYQNSEIARGLVLSDEQKQYVYQRVLHEMMMGHKSLALYGLGPQEAIREYLENEHNLKCRKKIKNIYYFDEPREFPYYEVYWE